jgi:hypothetical protein
LAFFTISLQQPLDCPIADRARQTQKGMYVTHRLAWCARPDNNRGHVIVGLILFLSNYPHGQPHTEMSRSLLNLTTE